MRFTINDSKDSKNIINYCNFNKLSNVRHNILYKKRYNWTNQEVMELNEMITSKNMMIGKNVNATLDSSAYVRFNLNQEIELSNLNENTIDEEHPRLPLFIRQNLKLLVQDLDKQNIDQYLKTFRYKKRFSFTTPDRLFRFDLSIVKMSKKNEKNQGIPTYKFKDSYTLEQPENYEVEIEYIGPKDGSQSILTVKDDLMVHIQNLLKVIKDTDVLLDKNEELQVLDDLRNTIAL